MKERLPIPGWLPLLPQHTKLLEACATEPQVIPGATIAPSHHLESIAVICCVDAPSRLGERTYIATEKGLRALRVQKIMKELGIVRQRRPVARFPDNDLVQLVVVLEDMIAAHRRVLSGLQATSRRS
jgi:hypothetical protein